ncbi:apolipoprotein D and lipocalin family protein [Mariprofundus ferrinatatus]|uniref:Outer membrane lipoprotein Blc n=1 Tax=Mariprofundus ferrinatatus TaxID=1921087 RepID=A0A2K8L9F4_9PROT|nr:lipocalin family protein [Mariprofundus ferrinatatus]ATX80906.1 apolipoprotein D and lipocalin family protein [Mariprofundus ferrinatatus]
MFKRTLLCFFLSVFAVGCTRLPEGIQPVQGFELPRYLGKWYEIARLDHSFERGLEQVTAEYSLREDGGVRVINRGYLSDGEAWKQAEGKAYFVDGANKGHLKVSFFGPFYASYVVFDLDQEHYQHSFVTGPDRSYLWLLSRNPSVSPALMDRFIKRAKALGYDTDQLIMVKHAEDPR